MKALKGFLLIVLATLLIAPSIGQAVTVMPPILEDINLNPGESFKGSFKIRNETDSAHTYYLNAQNIAAVGEEGESTIFSEEESQIDLSSWIQFEMPQLVLNVGETADVNFTINPPIDAEPGGHYASIFTSTTPTTGEQIGLGEKTGVILLVTVSGDIRERAELVEYSISSGKTLYNRPPVEFLVRIKNFGNVHFKPKGEIAMNGWLGEKAKISANPVGGNVLPNSIRALHPVWKGPAERGGFMEELKNEWNNFAFGRYNAHLEMEWGTNKEKMIGNVKFWVIPWRVLLVGLLGVIIILLLIRGYNKSIVKRAQKKK